MPYVGAPPPDGRSASNDEVGIGVIAVAGPAGFGDFFGADRAGAAGRAVLRRAVFGRAAFFDDLLELVRRGLALLDDALRAGLLRLGALRFAFFLATVVPPRFV
jgi:hypothetical protein